MADKLAELKATLERLPDEGLRLVLEFTEFLKKQEKKKTGKG
ncbi:hypothetical protein ES707_02975 [subsurface metagenome]